MRFLLPKPLIARARSGAVSVGNVELEGPPNVCLLRPTLHLRIPEARMDALTYEFYGQERASINIFQKVHLGDKPNPDGRAMRGHHLRSDVRSSGQRRST